MGRTLTQQQAIDELNASTKVTVGPNLIAAAMGMSPSVLRKHVRDGDYSLSTYDIQGSRIRFFRKDFLQKIGEIPPDEEKPTVEQLLTKLIGHIDVIETAMVCLMTSEQRELLKDVIEEREKTAGAATPTE